jgi:hypothetical protein
MSLIMLSRDVRPWCGINSIAEFSDNNNHNDNDDNSLELESALTHLVSKIEVKKRVISNESEFVKVTKKPKKLDFSNIVSSKGKSLEIFADESEGNDGLKMKKTRVPVIENGKDDYKKKEKMEIEVDSDSALEGY